MEPSDGIIELGIVNPSALRLGSTPRCSFDRAGGVIGCQNARWTLVDTAGRIAPLHCSIVWADNHFCVLDNSGLTRINDSSDPMGRNVLARLSEGDILHIGPYQAVVHYQDAQSRSQQRRALAQYGLDELLDEHAIPFDSLPLEAVALDRLAIRHEDISAFEELVRSNHSDKERDPLKILDIAQRRDPLEQISLFDPNHYGMTAATTQEDLAQTRFEAVVGSPHIPGEFPMPQTDAAWMINPLLEGLGVPFDDQPPAHEKLLRETGQALHAAIAGILRLYASHPATQRRMALLGRTLQPIEDNPLRLNQSYEETVRSLFSKNRSVVHLSPQTAVEEIFEQLERHHTAMLSAIEAALDTLLRAFSPETLMQRFRRYRPDLPQSASSGDWGWQMYIHYYNELISSRQQGFEKLFWEVFEQAYDRAMRSAEATA